MEQGKVPTPREPVDAAELPTSLTFYLSMKERTAVLRALKRVDADRTAALLRAVGVDRGVEGGNRAG